MYIEYDNIDNYLEKMKESNYISPSGAARDIGISHRTMINWINWDVIDAISYRGREGIFVLIDMDDYDKLEKFKNRDRTKQHIDPELLNKYR
jgi:hypothetical protein